MKYQLPKSARARTRICLSWQLSVQASNRCNETIRLEWKSPVRNGKSHWSDWVFERSWSEMRDLSPEKQYGMSCNMQVSLTHREYRLHFDGRMPPCRDPLAAEQAIRTALPHNQDIRSRITFVRADVTDPSTLPQAVTTKRAVVAICFISLAAWPRPKDCRADSLLAAILGVCRTCLQVRGCAGVIFAASASVGWRWAAPTAALAPCFASPRPLT